jgi:hypothetical protein
MAPAERRSVIDFLRGLSLDELECLADFEGACTLEACVNVDLPGDGGFKPYRLLASFFDVSDSDRWCNADDCAHKAFVALAWLEFRTNYLRISPAHATRG